MTETLRPTQLLHYPAQACDVNGFLTLRRPRVRPSTQSTVRGISRKKYVGAGSSLSLGVGGFFMPPTSNFGEISVWVCPSVYNTFSSCIRVPQNVMYQDLEIAYVVKVYIKSGLFLSFLSSPGPEVSELWPLFRILHCHHYGTL